MDHWASGIVYECSEIAGSHRANPQQPTMSVVKPERGPAASVKPGQKSCVRSSGIIWTSGNVYDCSAIAGSPHYARFSGEKSNKLCFELICH